MNDAREFDLEQINPDELEDLKICLRLDGWSLKQAPLILIGLVPECVSHVFSGRYALLPGNSPFRAQHSYASYRGHLNMELAEVMSFVSGQNERLRPYQWVQLSCANNYEPPWLGTVRRSEMLHQLLLESRYPKFGMSREVSKSELCSRAAISLHDLTSYDAAKRLVLNVYDLNPPLDRKERRIFLDWAKNTCSQMRLENYKDRTIENRVSEINSDADGRSTQNWIKRFRAERASDLIPIDVTLPEYPRDAEMMNSNP